MKHAFHDELNGRIKFRGTVNAVTRQRWIRVHFDDLKKHVVHPDGLEYEDEAQLPEYRPVDPEDRGDVLLSDEEVLKELKVGIIAPINKKKKKKKTQGAPPLRRR